MKTILLYTGLIFFALLVSIKVLGLTYVILAGKSKGFWFLARHTVVAISAYSLCLWCWQKLQGQESA
jgi:hypothetical protein